MSLLDRFESFENSAKSTESPNIQIDDEDVMNSTLTNCGVNNTYASFEEDYSASVAAMERNLNASYAEELEAENQRLDEIIKEIAAKNLSIFGDEVYNSTNQSIPFDWRTHGLEGLDITWTEIGLAACMLLSGSMAIYLIAKGELIE